MKNTKKIKTTFKPLKSSQFKYKIQKCLFCRKLHLLLFVLIIPIGSSYQRTTFQLIESNESNNGKKLTQELEIKTQENNIKKYNTSSLIRNFYASRNYAPFWTNNYKPLKQADQIISLMEEARYYGLNPNFFDIEKLRNLYASILDETELKELLEKNLELEICLSDNTFKLMSYLRKGIIYTDSIDFKEEQNWFLKSLPFYLETSGSKENFTEYMLELQPLNREYEYLQKGLEKFLANHVIHNNVISICNPEKDSVKAYNSAKNLLADFGFLKVEDYENKEAFIVALKKYQANNGIEPSGNICKKTYMWLNHHTYEKYKTIIINLERNKRNLYEGNYYAMVNIPSYELSLVKNRKEDKVFKAVIGSPSSPTPVLSSKIEKVVTFPTWNVPTKIAKYELLSKIKKDPNFLSRNNYGLYDNKLNPVNTDEINWEEINVSNFDYTIIQNSSRWNALGIIKFIFPNIHRVFVHDTQSKNLFNSSYRAHSHGCIRLQNPDEFAARILFNDLDSVMVEKLHKNLKNQKNEDIFLSEPLNIHLRYFTCQADENGNLFIYKDIYKKDQAIKERLFNPQS